MFKLLKRLFFDEMGGLGILRASLTSAIADGTGDAGPDAIVKIRRVINEQGPQFCMITDWPFLRSDLTFSITNANGHYYSGADYLPTTFKRVLAASIYENSEYYPLHEVGIKEAYGWSNPDENEGRPDEFCITRMESGYWQIKFNRKPAQTYTVYLEIALQWSDLTADTSETVITKPYYTAFAHYCKIARFEQQGDTENLALYRDKWFNPNKPQASMLTQILSSLSTPAKRKRLKMDANYMRGTRPTADYADGVQSDA